jgi:sterol desaturase/sphingolipid hydroxylase (fatty acid hydroxylase superfamily)
MEDFLSRILNYTSLIPWIALIMAGIPIERAVPQGRPAQQKDTTVTNIINGIAVFLMSLFLMPTAVAMTAWLVQKTGSGFIDLQISLPNKFLSEAATVLLFIFIYDLFFYLWHRAEHHFAFLWHIHAVHHSDTYFNITTYIRQHWLEQLLQVIFIGFPMALLFQFSPMHFFAGAMVAATWNFFTHMNIRLDMRGFTKVLAGPQYHRLHHSIQPEHRDVNFAQFLPVFDVMFSTYCPPKKDEYPATGLYSGESMDQPIDLFMWPFRKYWGYFKKISRF